LDPSIVSFWGLEIRLNQSEFTLEENELFKNDQSAAISTRKPDTVARPSPARRPPVARPSPARRPAGPWLSAAFPASLPVSPHPRHLSASFSPAPSVLRGLIPDGRLGLTADGGPGAGLSRLGRCGGPSTRRSPAISALRNSHFSVPNPTIPSW